MFLRSVGNKRRFLGAWGRPARPGAHRGKRHLESRNAIARKLWGHSLPARSPASGSPSVSVGERALFVESQIIMLRRFCYGNGTDDEGDVYVSRLSKAVGRRQPLAVAARDGRSPCLGGDTGTGCVMCFSETAGRRGRHARAPSHFYPSKSQSCPGLSPQEAEQHLGRNGRARQHHQFGCPERVQDTL